MVLLSVLCHRDAIILLSARFDGDTKPARNHVYVWRCSAADKSACQALLRSVVTRVCPTAHSNGHVIQEHIMRNPTCILFTVSCTGDHTPVFGKHTQEVCVQVVCFPKTCSQDNRIKAEPCFNNMVQSCKHTLV